MFFGEEYDECVDIWALGVVLFYCTAGYFPFESYVLQKLSYKIMFEEPLYPMTASDELLDLLQKLLNKEPEERIKLNEIFEHEWVKMGSTSGQAAEEAKAKGEILTEIGDEENIENKLTTEIKNETNEENIDNESKTDEKRENRTPSPKRGIPSIPRLPGRKEGVGNKPTPPRPEKSFKPQHNREVMRRKQRILTGSSYDLGNFAPTNGSQSNIRRRSRMNDSFDNVAELMSSQSSHLCDSMPYGTVFG
ncbi:hypothetical protein TRFO_33478 [Tritrichomonas foetus]|uniref:Protein kinase domain-containing protein n=1 Tax=Tritrichomonas foetus TaxID=1144522 RepID=A0A1J4JRV3_9EUKA|nr:hypothetical protein TRFO_33478 [Tritrichomonas foetus]|eukprot:OHS99964.1 hypothetical protein TRFO_33478 [Tritrichomonas foetus]